jgi:[ribosomal protein S5]-alanine N-acetyltransferase
MQTINKIFETDRLFLRELSLDDLESVFQIFSDPIAMNFYPRTRNLEETKLRIQWNLDSYEKNAFGLWACISKETEKFIGQAGLIFYEDVNGQEEVEISCSFIRKYWRQRFATETLRACIDYGFHQLNLQRLIGMVHPDHVVSHKLMNTLGLRKEKVITQFNKKIDLYSIHLKHCNVIRKERPHIAVKNLV